MVLIVCIDRNNLIYKSEIDKVLCICYLYVFLRWNIWEIKDRLSINMFCIL